MANQIGKQTERHGAVLSRLQAACVDGRAENVRYRQDQLQLLHRSLRDQSEAIRKAIANDTGCTKNEATVEYTVAMAALRSHYDSLNFSQSIVEEYQGTKAIDNLKRAVSVGLVYIVPSSAFPFFSTLTPIAAAITAGNCVLLESQNTLQALRPLLCQSLTKALDSNTFAVVENSAIHEVASISCSISVVQDDSYILPKTMPSLRSPQSVRTIAVVDRTGDIPLAAKSLVMASFAFGGRSAYAPDVVLVNEFVKKAFLEAASREAIEFFDRNGHAENGLPNEKRHVSTSRDKFTQLAAEGSADIVYLGTRGCIVDITSRDSSLLASKLTVPLLAVVSVSSLDDAINFLNGHPTHKTLGGIPYLASFIFAKPTAAKYLGQYINASASFLNILPADLLVGPPAPHLSAAGITATSFPLDIRNRYSRAMFEVVRPQFAANPNLKSPSTTTATSALSSLSEKSLETASGTESLLLAVNSPVLAERMTQYLVNAADAPLKPTGQPYQARKVGFFEQGLITGGIVFLGPVVISAFVVAFAGALYGGRWVLQSRWK